jgi:hypothetical protein
VITTLLPAYYPAGSTAVMPAREPGPVASVARLHQFVGNIDTIDETLRHDPVEAGRTRAIVTDGSLAGWGAADGFVGT